MKLHLKVIVLVLSLFYCAGFSHARTDDDHLANQLKSSGATLKDLLPKAQAGDAQSQHLVGLVFQRGLGTEANAAEAAKWFRASALQGIPSAMQALGQLYFRGQGVESNVDEAARWFRNARNSQSTTKANTGLPEASSPRQLSARELKECRQVVPQMPRLAIDNNIQGTVLARVLIVDGFVEDVVILSGPKVFHEVVRKAMTQYDCSALQATVIGRQEFVFAIEGEADLRNSISLAVPTFWSEPPPFNANWNGLSLEQKKAVKSQYESLPANDEPPYPTGGLGDLLENIRWQALRLGIEGNWRLEAMIGTDGKVESVGAPKSTNQDFAKATAAVIYHTAFKPAVCGGSPCAMKFPIEFAISSSKPTSEAKQESELKALRLAAESGDAHAQNELGSRHEYGRGVNRDVSQAFTWYMKAASQGFAESQNNLGRLLERGQGIERNPAEAATWFRRSAEQGYAPGQLNYGNALAYGRGIEVDLEGSVTWYQLAVDQGNVEAMNSLGLACETGRGIQLDTARAFALYERAASNNNSWAQLNLARAYASGLGTEPDIQKFIYWTKRSAHTGNSTGHFVLGGAYAFGLGVPIDFVEAARWFKVSADQGNALGQEALAEAYQRGSGVPQDDAQALKWYQRATDQRQAEATYKLSKLYATGRGTPQDLGKAMKLLHRAADMGFIKAQFDLATAYKTGNGVEANESKSAEWHKKAADKVTQARERLKSNGIEKVWFDHCSTHPVASDLEGCKELIQGYTIP